MSLPENLDKALRELKKIDLDLLESTETLDADELEVLLSRRDELVRLVFSDEHLADHPQQLRPQLKAAIERHRELASTLDKRQKLVGAEVEMLGRGQQAINAYLDHK